MGFLTLVAVFFLGVAVGIVASIVVLYAVGVAAQW